jgi:hypothetical protein
MEGSKAWWPMEGSKAWWPMQGSKAWWSMEGSKLGGHWNVKDKHLFTFSIFPQPLYLHPQFFPFYFTILLYHGPKPLLPPFFPLLRTINYDCAPQRNKSSPPPLSNWFQLKI